MGGVLLTAPTVIPLVFGNAYAMTVPVLQLMSPVIFIKFVNFGLAAFLTGGQNQNRRAQIQVFLAFLNVITTLIGAVGWGLVGAVMVDILTEVCMTVGYLLGIWRLVGEWHTR
jgi:O-antigen/teichoic acid export membrane protein